jgi:hypothetical protein
MLIDYLDGFEDNIAIVIGCHKLICPLTYEIEYKSRECGIGGRILINLTGSTVLKQ